MIKTSLEDAVACLAAVQRYYENLPDPAFLLSSITPAASRSLCAAVDLARSADSIESVMSEMTQHLVDALPSSWPAGWSSFSYRFYACCRGEVPVQGTIDTATNEVVVEAVPSTVKVH